jgi:cob(I)alamin adenosyltransferase
LFCPAAPPPAPSSPCPHRGASSRRLAVELAAVEPVNGQAIAYLNRLSDHLFVMARRLNDGGKKDMLWQPGANR